MKASPLLPLYQEQRAGRAGRDRLELLTALIEGAAFDPLFRAGVIRIPAWHPVFWWACLVPGCERPRKASIDMCHIHHQQWAQARGRGDRQGRVPHHGAAAGPFGLGAAGALPDLPAGLPRTPAGCYATATTAAGITTSAAKDSRPASRTGWPPRSPSTGTGPAEVGRLPGPGGHTAGPVHRPPGPLPG